MSSPCQASTIALKPTGLLIYQGDDYAAVVTVQTLDGTPADLTGYTAEAQIRRDVADRQPVVTATMNVNIELTTSSIFLTLTHTQTLALMGTYVWDRQITDTNGVVTTILAGPVTVTQEVTR
jgi:hypothetical protein